MVRHFCREARVPARLPSSAHVPGLGQRLGPVELRIPRPRRPARAGAEIALVLRQARRLPAHVAGDPDPARGVVVVEGAVGHVHAEDGDVAGLEVGGEEAGAARLREAHGVRAEVGLAARVLDHVEADHGVDQVAEAVRAFDHDEGATFHRHVAERQPDRPHLVVGTGEEGIVVVEAGGAAGDADAEEHVILRHHGLARHGRHDPAHGLPVRDRAQGRPLAHRLPEGAEVGLALGARGAAGEDVGAGLDLVHRLQPGQDLAPGRQHRVRVQHATEVEKAVRFQAGAQALRVVEQPRQVPAWVQAGYPERRRP